MVATFFLIGLQIMIFVGQIFVILIILNFSKNENLKSGPLVKPPAKSLKPWAKKPEKKKPVINDDLYAWKIENNLDRN